MEAWWERAEDETLHQGDYLPGCRVPLLPADFADTTRIETPISLEERDLIVITQSCDLENAKITLVTLCSVWSVAEFSGGHQRSFRIHTKADLEMEQRPKGAGTCSPLAAVTDCS